MFILHTYIFPWFLLLLVKSSMNCSSQLCNAKNEHFFEIKLKLSVLQNAMKIAVFLATAGIKPEAVLTKKKCANLI